MVPGRAISRLTKPYRSLARDGGGRGRGGQRLQDRLASKFSTSTRDIQNLTLATQLFPHLPDQRKNPQHRGRLEHEHDLPHSIFRGGRTNHKPNSGAGKVAPESSLAARQKFLSDISVHFFRPMSANEGVRNGLVCAMPAWCASCKVHSNGADQEGTPSSWSHPLSPTSTVERLLAPPPCLTAAEAWQCGTREQCLLTCKRQYQPHHSSSTTRSVPDMTSPCSRSQAELARAENGRRTH
jgi:hypothetical protein